MVRIKVASTNVISARISMRFRNDIFEVGVSTEPLGDLNLNRVVGNVEEKEREVVGEARLIVKEWRVKSSQLKGKQKVGGEGEVLGKKISSCWDRAKQAQSLVFEEESEQGWDTRKSSSWSEPGECSRSSELAVRSLSGIWPDDSVGFEVESLHGGPGLGFKDLIAQRSTEDVDLSSSSKVWGGSSLSDGRQAGIFVGLRLREDLGLCSIVWIASEKQEKTLISLLASISFPSMGLNVGPIRFGLEQWEGRFQLIKGQEFLFQRGG
ncbi:hypothetical protein LINPERPRIM_LOCUS27777 [Linum perenne]